MRFGIVFASYSNRNIRTKSYMWQHGTRKKIVRKIECMKNHTENGSFISHFFCIHILTYFSFSISRSSPLNNLFSILLFFLNYNKKLNTMIIMSNNKLHEMKNDSMVEFQTYFAFFLQFLWKKLETAEKIIQYFLRLSTSFFQFFAFFHVFLQYLFLISWDQLTAYKIYKLI